LQQKNLSTSDDLTVNFYYDVLTEVYFCLYLKKKQLYNDFEA